MPTLADPVTMSQLSFVPIRVGNVLPTGDLFPSYTMSPEYSLYALAITPVTTDMPDTSEYLSPGRLDPGGERGFVIGLHIRLTHVAFTTVAAPD